MSVSSTTTYRRREGSDTWHWMPACRWWPKARFGERKKKPTRGDLCNECRAKQGRAILANVRRFAALTRKAAGK